MTTVTSSTESIDRDGEEEVKEEGRRGGGGGDIR